MSDGFLSLNNLQIRYGETVAVPNLSLAIQKGELLALLGPSGCGKTTTMRAIAGLLKPAGGQIMLDGRNITGTAANRRDIGLVFQAYALFPHLTAFENVAFGLRMQKLPKEEIQQRTMAGLELVSMDGFANRKPAELSGGQQQRLALARSLVVNPKLLLLDEPLSNLDAKLRLEMRAELQRVQKETGITMIFVTHDQGEALGLADRVSVVRARAEDVVRGRGPVTSLRAGVVTARAVAALDKLAAWTVPLLEPGGVLLALKGRSAPEEVTAASDTLRKLGVDQVDIVECGVGEIDPPTTVVRAWRTA